MGFTLDFEDCKYDILFHVDPLLLGSDSLFN